MSVFGRRFSRSREIAVGLGIAYVLLALFLTYVVNFDLFRSDVKSYWMDSLDWQRPFHPFHVPGYPLMIALVRSVSFNLIPPVIVMMGINLAALLVCAVLVKRLLLTGGIPEPYAAIGAYLFGLWPLVGLIFTVYPIADLPAMALFLAGLYSLQAKRLPLAMLLLGLAMVTHKALWSFVGMLSIAHLIFVEKRISRQLAVSLILLAAPIGILWFFGTLHHGDPLWLIVSNFDSEVSSRSVLPFFDGLIGTIFLGGIFDLSKGLIVASMVCLAIGSLYVSFRNTPPYSYYGLAISASALLLLLMLNQYEIWAAVRFSRLLVVPLFWSGYHRFRIEWLATNQKLAWAAIMTAFLASQFVFAWYLGAVYL